MIRSHVIPRFYLKQFAFQKPNEKHYVYLYQKGKKPEDRWTKKVGRIEGYFGYVLPDGTVEESMEQKLKVLEEGCMDILISAQSDLFVFTRDNRRKMAFYAALLHSRTTQRLEWNKKSWLEIHRQLDEAIKEDDYADELAQYFSVKYGNTLSRQSLRDTLNALIMRSATEEQGKNNFLEELLNNANTTVDALLDKQMRIWKAPKGTEFVTSDNPLVTFVVVPNGEFAPGFGFRRKETIAFMPISPTRCISFGGEGRDPMEHFELNVDAMRKLTWAMIASAHHFVYANTQDASIKQMGDELIGTYIYGEHSFVPRQPLPTVKDFLRVFLGVAVRSAKAGE